jgi:SAM-dependent methyltransferase
MATMASVVLAEPGRALAAALAIQVWHVHPPGYRHAGALTELAESVYFGLRRLGIAAFYREPPDRPVRQIVVGAHLLDERQLGSLAPDAIIYNTEQIDSASPWLGAPYFQALTRRPVWDYSAENVLRLSALGVCGVRHVPLGYVPELVRIPPLGEEIDVLFYGSVNARRRDILEALTARGLKVVALFGTYGEERDQAIAHAKVVLSVHFYAAKIFEIVRAAYLFANAKAVVAECGPDTSIDRGLREAVCGVPYTGLVEACVELVRDAGKRAALGQRAQRIFAERREEDILGAALGLAPPPAADGPAGAPALPSTLQLGGGGHQRPECFSIDVDPASRPDAVCDICSPALVGTRLDTRRFGTITLAAESFDLVIASHVLEHLRDQSTAMTNLLRLLKPGGVCEIVVPYDPGCGAEQDATRGQAFNERSWLCYTDWHWRLGWLEARFDLVSLRLQASAFGGELQRASRSAEEIVRAPGAIEALYVRLRKRYLQESERREALRRQAGRAA